MLSPLVQPISRSRSGTGAVATMSLETTTSERRSSGRLEAQAFVARTSFSAASTPRGVRTVNGRSRLNATTGEPSKMRTPASRATRRSPRTRAAGCTVTALGSRTPARCFGGTRAARDLGGGEAHEGRDAESLAEPEYSLPGADVGEGGRGPQHAAAAQVGVEPMRGAEPADVLHGVL